MRCGSGSKRPSSTICSRPSVSSKRDPTSQQLRSMLEGPRALLCSDQSLKGLSTNYLARLSRESLQLCLWLEYCPLLHPQCRDSLSMSSSSLCWLHLKQQRLLGGSSACSRSPEVWSRLTRLSWTTLTSIMPSISTRL